MEGIVKWVEDNGDLLDDEIEVNDPYERALLIITDPSRIPQYEDMDGQCMNGEELDEGGCQYIFTRGQSMGSFCRTKCVEGGNRCSFHNHPIFKIKKVNINIEFFDFPQPLDLQD